MSFELCQNLNAVSYERNGIALTERKKWNCEELNGFQSTKLCLLLISFCARIEAMRALHKAHSHSQSRRPTVIYLVFAAAFFALLVFGIQFSLFAGETGFGDYDPFFYSFSFFFLLSELVSIIQVEMEAEVTLPCKRSFRN